MHGKRIRYIDDLKLLAILGIILIHISILWPKLVVFNVNISKFCSPLGHYGVPLFLMISGVLLLNRNYSDIYKFYKKRIIRVALPYIFWILIFTLVSFSFWQISYVNSYSINLFFDTFCNNIGWYAWMIIGISLAIPFINEFILHRDFKDLNIWIYIIILTSIFYQIFIYFHKTTFMDLRFFIGPLAYIVLGYYLAHKDFKLSANKMIIICFILFIITSILKDSQFFDPKLTYMKYQSLSIAIDSHLDVSFLALVQVSSIFLLCKNLHSVNVTGLFKKLKNLLYGKTVSSFVESVSRASYGMYLSHITILVFIPFIFNQFQLSDFKTLILIIILTILTFIISWIVVLIISKIPILKEFSGYS